MCWLMVLEAGKSETKSAAPGKASLLSYYTVKGQEWAKQILL